MQIQLKRSYQGKWKNLKKELKRLKNSGDEGNEQQHNQTLREENEDLERQNTTIRVLKIAGIGVLKRVQLTVCGMKCIDLRNEAIKIFRHLLLI